MYPFIRYTSTIIKAAIEVKKGNALTFKDTGEIHFYCRLSDIDNFLEMNNGRVLTLRVQTRVPLRQQQTRGTPHLTADTGHGLRAGQGSVIRHLTHTQGAGIVSREARGVMVQRRRHEHDRKKTRSCQPEGPVRPSGGHYL